MQVDVTTRGEVLKDICEALPRGEDAAIIPDPVTHTPQLWTATTSSSSTVRAAAPPRTALETQYARQVHLASQPAPDVAAPAPTPVQQQQQQQPPRQQAKAAVAVAASPATQTPAPRAAATQSPATARTAAIQVTAESTPGSAMLQAPAQKLQPVAPVQSTPAVPTPPVATRTATAAASPAEPVTPIVQRVSPAPSFSTAVTHAAGVHASRSDDATATATVDDDGTADGSVSSMLWMGAGVAVLAAAGIGAMYYMRSRK